jgi:hypothetical protein
VSLELFLVYDFFFNVNYCISIWRRDLCGFNSIDSSMMWHMKLALAALCTANQQEPKVNFDRYILGVR